MSGGIAILKRPKKSASARKLRGVRSAGTSKSSASIPLALGNRLGEVLNNENLKVFPRAKSSIWRDFLLPRSGTRWGVRVQTPFLVLAQRYTLTDHHVFRQQFDS